MSFIQIIEIRTKRFDELKALGEQVFEATEGFHDLDVVEDRT